MNQYRIIDLETWSRKSIFEFYRSFSNSAFHVSVKLDARSLYDQAKGSGESFFLLTLYAVLRAANEIPECRQRYEEGRIVEYERIAAMTPIMTDSGMFRQIWCEYEPDFPAFRMAIAPKVEEAKHSAPSPMIRKNADFLCANCAPWIHFESITTAESRFGQTEPVITWGRMADGLLPISCRFSHLFMDGLHTGYFFTKLNGCFTSPQSLYRRS